MRWLIFHILISLVLAIDLFSFRKGMKWRVALGWSLCWISLAFAFNGYIFWAQGSTKGLQFLTAYLMEKSLSVDNLFIFLLIFSYFKVPPHLQHRLLFWGVVGAFVLRLGMILGGVALVSSFHWITYVLGTIVGITGIKMILQKKNQLTLQKSRLLKWIQHHLPITEDHVEDRFIVYRRKKFYLTPLCLALVMLEGTDVLFAVDSIPAVLSVTSDVFIAYTSNVFAVLGLRDLFF